MILFTFNFSIVIKKLCTLIFLCCLFNIAQAQEKIDSSFVVSGKVIDSHSKKGIAYAYITIEQSFMGTVCDSLGFFSLHIQSNQAIKISAIGYKTQKKSIKTNGDAGIFIEIEMQKNSVLLKEVNVYAFGTWNDFKYQFLKKKLAPEKSIKIDNSILASCKYYDELGKTMRRGGLGISLGMRLGSRNNKKSNALRKLIAKEQQLQRKYNKKLVAQITHEKGIHLEALMSYINCNATFTYLSEEKDIIKEILRLHQKFRNNKDDKAKYYSLFDTLKEKTPLPH